MTAYRAAETVRQLINAAHESPLVTGELAGEVLTDVDAKAVVVALATLTAGAIEAAAQTTGAPFDLVLQRLLGLLPGAEPGADPDLGL